jgi:hypothetical protein
MPYRRSLNSRFETSISQVDEILTIHLYLHSVPVTQVTDNLLRAALTMLVSAIDTSIHELIINAVMFELSSRQIEGALAKIGIKKIWSKLSPVIGQAPDDIKIRLDLLVRRRNQIVHEGDLNHLHNLQVIERNDLDESLRFTKELMSGIIYEYTKLIV